MKKIIRLLLDLLFPRSETLKIAETLSFNDLFEKSRKNNLFRKNFWTIFCYKDKLVKEMMWQMKFNGQRRYAIFFGKCLYKKIIEIIDTNKKYILIPVPVHKKRRKERGFNQCEWLCEEIVKIDIKKNFLYKPDILQRIIYRQKQSWSSKKKRVENIDGVFTVIDVTIITNKSVIIVDDVLTTGATLEEIIKTVSVCKPKEVLAFTVAH
jgi:competence protein ComFC